VIGFRRLLPARGKIGQVFGLEHPICCALHDVVDTISV